MASRKETAAGIVGVSVLAKSPAARRALVGLLRQGGRTLGPWGLAAWLAYEGYIRRDQLRSVANEIAERLPPAMPGQGGDPTFGARQAGIVDIGQAVGSELADIGGVVYSQTLEPFVDLGKKRRDLQRERERRRKKGLQKVKSKFNKAVSKAYSAVKRQKGKRTPAKAFKQATKIASRANPATKSRIGKGKSFAQKTARKIRKSVWGTIRRKK